MKHFLRDTIIYLVSISGISYLYRKNLFRKGPLVKVVVFHDVPDRGWFEEMIGTLVKHFNVITPNEFNNKEFSKDKINILVTFDDGYQSWVSVAKPVFEKYGIKGLFFISSGLLDVEGDRDAEILFLKKHFLLKPRKVLSWDGAKELLASGHTVGGHSRKHRKLAKVGTERARKTIQYDKDRLENMLGVQLTDFAYPFGRRQDFNDDIAEVVKNIGYTRAYTAESGFVMEEDFDIPRMGIESNTSADRLVRWVNGGYDIFSKLK